MQIKRRLFSKSPFSSFLSISFFKVKRLSNFSSYSIADSDTPHELFFASNRRFITHCLVLCTLHLFTPQNNKFFFNYQTKKKHIIKHIFTLPISN